MTGQMLGHWTLSCHCLCATDTRWDIAGGVVQAMGRRDRGADTFNLPSLCASSLQSSNWTSDLFNTYCYIFNLNQMYWNLIIIRIRGLTPLQISLINKYWHLIDTQNIQWNSQIRASPVQNVIFKLVVEDLCRSWQKYRFSASLQAHQAAWFITKRNITSIDRHDQFKLLKNCSDI